MVARWDRVEIQESGDLAVEAHLADFEWFESRSVTSRRVHHLHENCIELAPSGSGIVVVLVRDVNAIDQIGMANIFADTLDLDALNGCGAQFGIQSFRTDRLDFDDFRETYFLRLLVLGMVYLKVPGESFNDLKELYIAYPAV